MNGARRWQIRLDATDDEDSRQQRRDRARATRKPSHPRRRAQEPRIVTLARMRSLGTGT